MKNTFLTGFFLFVFCFGFAQNSNLKSPSEFLGYSLGDRFTRHHKVIDYFKYVSSHLQNVSLKKYGETNEYRELYVSILSSSENMNNIEEIRTANLNQTGLLNGSKTNNKAIVWLSYNVHGNEASSTEAAMLTLYKLVTEKQDWLKNTVVIIDPCVNPDGRDRYVNWYNQVKSTPYNSNQTAKEHSEPWPGGRPNHYLFDLNRDWAWATQVETQQRLKIYNKWMPHIHVDFHEQGINDPYYFAPAAKPFHEIITNWQKDFQTQIGRNHAKYFDKESWLYFTKESFDLLYPSYGDTYPTYMGAIGMTYEQAGHGRAGLGIQTDEGEVLTLKDRIAHHTTTGLSTVEISNKNAEKLNLEFQKFFDNKNLKIKSYVLKNTNIDKINQLKKLLEQHEIAFEYAKKTTVKGLNYKTQKDGKLAVDENDLVIHTNQPKGKMVDVLFEPKTQLQDSVTYDITAWSLPYAYGLPTIASATKVASTKPVAKKAIKNIIDSSAYAYISKWNSIQDASFLGDLLQHDVLVRFSEKSFSIAGKSFNSGSLIILRNDNKTNEFDQKLIEIANKHQRKLQPVNTGFVNRGVDFGSYSVKPIQKQKIAVLSGSATSSLSFGEVWHFFETQLHYPITNINKDELQNLALNDFDVLILPNGYYSSILKKEDLNKVKTWIKKGGTLIAIGNALQSFAGKDGFSLKAKKADKATTNSLIPYNQRERQSISNYITGSIVNATLDTSHPLAFGYDKNYYSLKLNASSYSYLKENFNVGYFSKNAKTISGFTGYKAEKKIPESLCIGEETIGEGSIVYFVDNPLFRSFWENGKLFVANAVFFLNSDKIK